MHDNVGDRDPRRKLVTRACARHCNDLNVLARREDSREIPPDKPAGPGDQDAPHQSTSSARLPSTNARMKSSFMSSVFISATSSRRVLCEL